MRKFHPFSKVLFRPVFFTEAHHRNAVILVLGLVALMSLHAQTIFALASPPTITSFSPDSAPVGAKVTITGTNLFGASVVDFNGAKAGFEVVSKTQITALVPKSATTGPISVTAPGGTVKSAAGFTVVLPPAITGFTPTGGLPGISVTITGTNFAGTTAVTFNGVSANFRFVSATEISATAPSGATDGPISVANPAKAATSTNKFTYCCLPAVQSTTPVSGVVGAQVAVFGTNFTFATAVKFNNVPCTNFTIQSAVLIMATVPSGATTGPVSVTNALGTGTSVQLFTVTSP